MLTHGAREPSHASRPGARRKEPHAIGRPPLPPVSHASEHVAVVDVADRTIIWPPAVGRSPHAFTAGGKPGGVRSDGSAMTGREEDASQGRRPASRPRRVLPRLHGILTVVLGIALVAMLIDHRQAIVGGNMVAIGLVVACLLIHPLMHRGHGARRGADEHHDDQP
jgi:hypothetical protein